MEHISILNSPFDFLNLKTKMITLSTRNKRSPGLIRPTLNTGPCGRIFVTIKGKSPPPRNVKPKQPFSRSTVICANFVVTHKLFCETVAFERRKKKMEKENNSEKERKKLKMSDSSLTINLNLNFFS